MKNIGKIGVIIIGLFTLSACGSNPQVREPYSVGIGLGLNDSSQAKAPRTSDNVGVYPRPTMQIERCNILSNVMRGNLYGDYRVGSTFYYPSQGGIVEYRKSTNALQIVWNATYSKPILRAKNRGEKFYRIKAKSGDRRVLTNKQGRAVVEGTRGTIFALTDVYLSHGKQAANRFASACKENITVNGRTLITP